MNPRQFLFKSISLWILLALPSPSAAQLEPIPEDRGATGLALKLRELASGVTFLHTTAHPDDEDNGLLVMLNRGRGFRTALLTVTRGDGGQNEIGPELFEAIGILRTEELMAMHRIDGAEQYFTRAYEFGYSFSVEETFEKWGKDEILGDIVRHIRTIRPDVVVSMSPEGEGGGQHHQASARLTQEAFRAAADPQRFPEQLRQGLRAWQPLKMYARIGIGAMANLPRIPDGSREGVVSVNTGVYDPLLGRTYYQMGLEARSNHRCQGMAQLRALAGDGRSQWHLTDSTTDVDGAESDLFAGIDTSLDYVLRFAEGEADEAMVRDGVTSIKALIARADAELDPKKPQALLPTLRDGLTRLRELLTRIQAGSLSDGAKTELAHRLSPKEALFEEAIVLAHGLSLDAIADRGELAPGESFVVETRLFNATDEAIEVDSLSMAMPEGWTLSDAPPKQVRRRGRRAAPAPVETRKPGIDEIHLASGEHFEWRRQVTTSADSKHSRPYWQRRTDSDRFDFSDGFASPEKFGLPAAPPMVFAEAVLSSGGVPIRIRKPVQYRYGGPWVGNEKQKEVSILPRVSLRLSPSVVVFPIKADARTRTLSVELVHKGITEVSGTLRLELPPGWRAEPKQADVTFARFDEARVVPFEITPSDNVSAGSYRIRAVVKAQGQEYREGVQTIAYHHIHTRYLYHPAEARVEALDISVAPVKVGYVEGVGDEIPTAIRQLGAELTFLESEDLAQGDLSQYDVIMTGIRAYLNREDLRAYNTRLLDYVEQGGTLLVQYNKFEFNDAQWGPYPKKVGRNRVTVEQAPIEILEPNHPVFRSPNTITEQDWDGWVQERGLYFLEEEGDPRYRDLLASEDPWDYNAGKKKGLLVEAQYGKGRWMYIGIGFFRQLPAGVPDAYKIFANLLSLPKTVANE